ncbi:MAG: ATP-binding protein [Mycoplasma sp.]
MWIKRDLYLDKLINSKHNGQVKIITGIRRCGKSFLLNEMFYKHLLDQGIASDHIIKFSFDNLEHLKRINKSIKDTNQLKKKLDAEVFLDYITLFFNDKKQYYVLLDEIQELPQFEYLLNALIQKGNVDVYVTGSNSKFLSKDVITQFSSRGMEIHVSPLSFKEFYDFKNGKISDQDILKEYILFGGLPPVVLRDNPTEKHNFLKTIIEKTYLTDICQRHRVKHSDDLNDLFQYIATVPSEIINPLRMTNILKSLKKSNIHWSTVKKYLDYFSDSYIVKQVKKINLFKNRTIGQSFKIYFSDLGLLNANNKDTNIQHINGHIIENLVHNELLYHGYDVKSLDIEVREKNKQGKSVLKNLEIDFFAEQFNKKPFYCQVTSQINSKEQYEREIKPFSFLKDHNPCYLIVNDPSYQIKQNGEGIIVDNLIHFLLTIDKKSEIV